MHERNIIIIDGEMSVYTVTSEGKVFRNNGTELYGTCDKDGYRVVRLTHNGQTKSYKVHRLVAEFINEDIIYGNEVHHKDSNRDNNNWWNLETCSPERHVELEKLKGKPNRSKGEEHGSAKYLDSEIISACELLSQGYSREYVSTHLNIDKSTLYSLVKGSGWNHITKDFNIVNDIVPRPEYSDEFKSNILNLLRLGLSPKKICGELGLEYTPKLVNYIKSMRRRKL